MPTRHLPLLLVLLLAAGTLPPAALPAASPSAHAAGAYQPPRFEQADRAARIRALAGEIEQIYKDYAESSHIPGVAYGVVVDDALILSGGMGFAEVGRRIPATPKSVFRIASMTKSVTALAVLRLRDAGRLDLDQPVSRHLPELRKTKLLTRDSPAITARHLLTHGAGFPEDNPWGDRQLADTEGDLVDLIREPVQFSNAPDVDFEYSNLGFALLGRLVHRVSGRSYQSYAEANIFRPLGMTSTYWDHARVPKDLLAHGYRWRDDEWQEEALLGDGSYASMGGLLTTIDDFARYMALHLSAWPPRDGAESGPLRRSSLREMQHPWRMSGLNATARGPDGAPCPEVSSYAFGLSSKINCQDQIRVGHSGGLPGFGSDWRILPAHGVGVVAFGNRTYAGMSRPTAKVLDLLLTRAGLQPRRIPPSDILRRRATELRELLPDWSGAEQSGIFAENFFPDNPASALRKKAQEMFQKAGPIQSVGEVEPVNQLRGTFKLRGSQATLAVFFTLTPENPPLIQEFQIAEEPKP